MTDPALSRAPFEIWERILLEVIDGPIFYTSCTSSNYLAFQQACFELRPDPENEHKCMFRASEIDRLTMRYVCRAWKAIADRWDIRERWIRILRFDKPISAERWRGAQRMDVFLPSVVNRREVASNDHPKDKLVAIFTGFRLANTGENSTMRLKKLSIQNLTEYNFIDIIKALCSAAQALTSLRSLILTIPTTNQVYLKMISEHFPHLTHLTLQAECRSRLDGDNPSSKVLYLPNLEVLMLILKHGYFELSNWILPALRHLFIGPYHDRCQLLGIGVLQFVNRFAAQLETLELGGLFIGLIMGSWILDGDHLARVPIAPTNFWETFPRLINLGCDIDANALRTYPKVHHPFKCLKPWCNNITSAADMKAMLDLWVYDDHVKRLESIVLEGRYLSSGAYLKDEPICSLLHTTGIRLLKPAGEPWIDI